MKKSLLSAVCLSFTLISYSEDVQAVPKTCGQSGSLQDKIKDCRSVNANHSTKHLILDEVTVDWNLVSVTPDSDNDVDVVWYDSQAGLSWGSRLEGYYDYASAARACRKLGLKLPSVDDYNTAESHGIRKVFNDFSGKLYWTSTPSEYGSAAYYYSGSEGFVEDGDKASAHSARCVK